MPDGEGSITGWVGRLKAGDVAALEPLWDRYFHRLVGLARARLGSRLRAAAAEEDVALDAMDSLCRGVAQGRFPRLDDRDDLWRLLVCITARKAAELRQREARVKRGGMARREAADISALDDILSDEPTPEMAAVLSEESRRLLDRLNDETLRRVAILKMEGHGTSEIASLIGTAPRTVERKLQLIRSIWLEDEPDAEGMADER